MKAQKETAVPTTKLDLNKVNPKLHSLAQEDSKELLGTAKHEAGHAIIAELCGGAVKEVNLYATNDKERAEKGFLGTGSHSHIYDNFKGLMVTCRRTCW